MDKHAPAGGRRRPRAQRCMSESRTCRHSLIGGADVAGGRRKAKPRPRHHDEAEDATPQTNVVESLSGAIPTGEEVAVTESKPAYNLRPRPQTKEVPSTYAPPPKRKRADHASLAVSLTCRRRCREARAGQGGPTQCGAWPALYGLQLTMSLCLSVSRVSLDKAMCDSKLSDPCATLPRCSPHRVHGPSNSSL